MKNYIQMLSKHQNVIHFLSILLISGMICGVMLSQWMDSEVIASLSSGAFSTILTVVDRKEFFITQFMTNIIICLLVLFLGFSVIGMPFVAFIIFTKGVQIGFSCAMYLITYHLKGMIGIILTLIPQVTFDALAVFVISTMAFELSFQLFKRSFLQTRPILWRQLLNEKLNGVLISFTLVLFSSLIKATLVLYLMELFALIQS